MTCDYDSMAGECERLLLGKPCWHVVCGGTAGTTFKLVLGDKIERIKPRKNPFGSSIMDLYSGEVRLLVWCPWRLDDPAKPISSSEDLQEHATASLQTLIGRNIMNASIGLPGWDMKIAFTGQVTLSIFATHFPNQDSFSTNWELFSPECTLAVNAGSQIDIQPSVPNE